MKPDENYFHNVTSKDYYLSKLASAEKLDAARDDGSRQIEDKGLCHLRKVQNSGPFGRAMLKVVELFGDQEAA